MIYIILVLLFISISYVEIITKDRKFSYQISFLTIIFLTFFASLRNNVGADWNSYYDFYKNGTDAVEFGYATLNNLFSKFSIPYFIFLTIINGFSLFLIYRFLQKNTQYKNLALLIFFCDLYLYFNLSGLRQAIAISLTCFSINYAIKEKIYHFILLIFLASLFHLTALIFIIVYFIPRNKVSKTQVIFFASLFTVSTIFINYFSEIITLYTNKNAYFYTNLQVNADNLRNLYYVGIAKRSIILILIFFFGNKIKQTQNFRYFLNIYLFGFFIYLTTYMVSPDIGVRLSSYFTIMDLLLISNLAYITSRKSAIIIFCVVSVVAVYKIMGYVNDETYIYHTILELN